MTASRHKPAPADRAIGPPDPPESPEERKRRARRLYRGLLRLYPMAHCELNHRNAFELLVATILSAQCTDVRVNQVTPALFAKYPTPRALAQAEPAKLEELIRSTGFYRNKAKALLASSRDIVDRFQGRVPDAMEELVSLHGVARKTANVVLGDAFGKNEGVVVDTHVKRLSARMGLTEHPHPDKVEQDLMQLFPRRSWGKLAHLLIWHGRRVCSARKPLCGQCGVRRNCLRRGV